MGRLVPLRLGAAHQKPPERRKVVERIDRFQGVALLDVHLLEGLEVLKPFQTLQILAPPQVDRFQADEVLQALEGGDGGASDKAEPSQGGQASKALQAPDTLTIVDVEIDQTLSRLETRQGA